MADHMTLWQWLIKNLDAQLPVALLVVVDTSGSSPAKVGAKMALTAQQCMGTIGGGAGEHRLINQARRMLASRNLNPQIIQLTHHLSKTTQPSGAICGGEQTVLIYPCRMEDRNLLEQLANTSLSNSPFGLKISTQGLQLMASPSSSLVAAFKDGECWEYQEIIGLRKRAFIIGGGHVSLALSRVLDWLGFDITVIDEREPPQSMQDNHFAWQKRQIAYLNVGEQIPEGLDVFVFIVTHSHYTDELVTAQLAKKHFAYLGLLGSRHKIAQIKVGLIGQLTTEQLQRLHAPMGLPINSHTPEEIAISIAAELIQIINAA